MLKTGIACFFVAAGAASLCAQEVGDDGTPMPRGPIPIVAGKNSDSSATPLQVTFNPLVTTRAANAQGIEADSANENVGVGYHVPLLQLFTVGYDTNLNAFRQDQSIFDDEGATSLVTTAWINKASLEEKSGEKLKLTEYVLGQRSFTDGQPGFADMTGVGTEAAWAPWKEITALKLKAARQETVQFDHSILEEKVYTGALDQKLPWVPFTLHTSVSLTDDALPASNQEKLGNMADASLEWKLIPEASISGGWHEQDTDLPATQNLQDGRTLFTQVAVQPAEDWGLTVRAAHEQKTTIAGDAPAFDSSDALVTFGVNWKKSDRWTAGFGVNYRVWQAQTPAPAQNTPPASLSLSAGGSF